MRFCSTQGLRGHQHAVNLKGSDDSKVLKGCNLSNEWQWVWVLTPGAACDFRFCKRGCWKLSWQQQRCHTGRRSTLRSASLPGHHPMCAYLLYCSALSGCLKPVHCAFPIDIVFLYSAADSKWARLQRSEGCSAGELNEDALLAHTRCLCELICAIFNDCFLIELWWQHYSLDRLQVLLLSFTTVLPWMINNSKTVGA